MPKGVQKGQKFKFQRIIKLARAPGNATLTIRTCDRINVCGTNLRGPMSAEDFHSLTQTHKYTHAHMHIERVVMVGDPVPPMDTQAEQEKLLATLTPGLHSTLFPPGVHSVSRVHPESPLASGGPPHHQRDPSNCSLTLPGRHSPQPSEAWS